MTEKKEKFDKVRDAGHYDIGLVFSNDPQLMEAYQADADWEEVQQDAEKLILKCAKFKKAFDEAVHRRMVKLITKYKVDEYLKKGELDLGEYCFGEMIKKEEENILVRFVTLSLDGTKNEDILDRVEWYNKFIKSRTYFPAGTKWVYEQRGESQDECGNGLHIHIIVPLSKKKQSELIRDIHNQTKLAKNFIDVKIRPLSHCLEYTTGAKNEHKNVKQAYDNVMRHQFGIEKLYSK